MVVNISSTNTSFLERTTSLTDFYKDVRKYKILSQEEELELFDKYHNGTPSEKRKSRDTLVNCNLRFVIAVAKKYAKNDMVMDLIDEGCLGLLEAIDTFDPKEGVKFMTWAVWYIRRFINFFIIDYGAIVKRNNSHKTHHILSQARNSFIQREMRKPTLEELAEMLSTEYGVKIKNLNDIADTTISSIDADFNAEDDETAMGTIGTFNSYSASTNGYVKSAEDDHNKQLVASLLKTVSDRDAKVIKLLYGIGCERAYEIQEVAEKCDLTTERVRQLKFSVIDKLKEEYKKMLNKLG